MMFNHPATTYTCRHCKAEIPDYDYELCLWCGPVCGDCFAKPCPRNEKEKLSEKVFKKEK